MNNSRVLSDLDILTKEGSIGFYSRCEVTEIFVHSKAVKDVFNLFTLLVFEDAEFCQFNDYLTKPSLIRINRHKNYSCGILRYYTSVEDAKKHFRSFLESNRWCLHGEHLKTSDEFIFLPKQYIPADDSLVSTPLNSVLKNNFHHHGGSYILECFDNKKADISFLIEDAISLRELSESIQQYVPIGISKASDRLGNIILQFPIEILRLRTSLKKDKTIEAEIIQNPKLEVVPRIEVLSMRDFDTTLAEFRLFSNDSNSTFSLGERLNGIKCILFNPENQLVLASSNNTIYLSGISLQTHIGVHEPRIFKVQHSGTEIPYRVEVSSLASKLNIGKRAAKNYTAWIKNRLYEQERAEQERTLSFVQYGRKKDSDDRQKALQDIRTLIKMYGEGGVYLWDPYLDYADIMNTLYFSEVYNAPLRAVSSLIKIKTDSDSLAYTIDNNNFGINLEFRIQYGDYGWSFHDRFLIFPEVYEDNELISKVRAWSLGTSVNSLGKSHHILQEVGNARNILDAFNELWSELDDPSCLVWKS